MPNVSKINFLRKIVNQTLRATYYPPKSRRDIEEHNPDYWNLSPDEIKESYSNDYINENGKEFIEDKGVSFRYKDGTEDVYTKSGYEHEIFEYLDRNLTNKMRYRIITDNSRIDFFAGGRIKIDGRLYEIIKVINMTNDVPTQNKYRGMKGVESPQKYAPKIIALI